MKIWTTYANEDDETVSYKQFWTFHFDQEGDCLVERLVIVCDPADVERLEDVLGQPREEL
jgi:hypothetical protein